MIASRFLLSLAAGAMSLGLALGTAAFADDMGKSDMSKNKMENSSMSKSHSKSMSKTHMKKGDKGSMSKSNSMSKKDSMSGGMK